MSCTIISPSSFRGGGGFKFKVLTSWTKLGTVPQQITFWGLNKSTTSHYRFNANDVFSSLNDSFSLTPDGISKPILKFIINRQQGQMEVALPQEVCLSQVSRGAGVSPRCGPIILKQFRKQVILHTFIVSSKLHILDFTFESDGYKIAGCCNI
jgi:hypothetical protein